MSLTTNNRNWVYVANIYIIWHQKAKKKKKKEIAVHSENDSALRKIIGLN